MFCSKSSNDSNMTKLLQETTKFKVIAHIYMLKLSSITIMKNHIHWNHTTLQPNFKKQLIYNYCATIALEIQGIDK
jgi:hypothetical protein